MNGPTLAQTPKIPTLSPAPSQTGLLQRKCACGGSPGVDGKCAECRAKRLSLQRSAANPSTPSAVPPIVHDVLSSPGQPLDSTTCALMGRRIGYEFSQIKLHNALQQGTTQTKLTVNQPGDKYEQEANRISAQVMQMPASSSKERHEQTFSEPTRALMEPRFGYNFSHVRVHADTKAAESAQALNAQAYTVGQDVVFGAGQYAPGTHAGQGLLAHELVHVMQQQSASPGMLQRKIKVENPVGLLSGLPPKHNWEEINDYVAALCSSFRVSSSGDITPLSAGICLPGPGSTACRCLCDLHNSANPVPWKIKIDDNTWPHTEEANRRVTTHSTRSSFSFGAWGGGAAAGRRISEDNPGVLGHELCGHAWLMERGIHPAFVAAGGGRPSHDPTVAIENKIAQERRGLGAEQRGLFAAPHHGESFARVTISGFPNKSSVISSLSADMQAKIVTIKDFMVREPVAIVDVIGHSDHTGSSAANSNISLERARSVKQKLTSLGIASARFRAVEGKSDTECPPPSSANPACRKVDVFLFVFEAARERFP